MKKRNFFKPAHRDKAEPLIITAGRSVGATITPLSGKDVPDLLVGFRGVTYLAEVKSRLEHEGKDGYTRKTTTRVSEGQKDFAEKWRGGTTGIVYEPADLLRMIGAPFVAETDGPRWLAENGAFLCEHCWLPENGLHAKDCPSRTALKPKPKVQSAHRAAEKMAEAMPKRHSGLGAAMMEAMSRPPSEEAKEDDFAYALRKSRGVEGELQPLKVKR